MNTRNRSLLAVALGTILIAPLAAAQSPQSNANARAKVQQDTVQHDAMQHDNKNALPPQVNPEEVLEQSVDPRVPTGDVADDALGAAPPPPPVQSRGAEHAADHSAVVQRDAWGRLDADGDGMISADEGEVDADFSANFEMMDGDDDGFVSDAEFRASAKAGTGDDAVDDVDDRDDDREADGDDYNEAIEPDPMNDRDGMDDDGTGMDDEDGAPDGDGT